MAEQSPLHDVTAAAGAVFTEEAGWTMPAHFGDVAAEYRHAREHAALFDISHHGKIEVTGPDAAAFLHNLCTNDIKALKPGRGCEAFLTTVKAKVIAYIQVCRDQEHVFWIDAGPGMGQRVLKHLDHHLISEQVELSDRTHDFAQLHLAGPQCRAVLEQARGDVVPRDRLAVPGCELLCLAPSASALWGDLIAAGARPVGSEVYNLLRIEAGIPVFGKEIDEDRFVVEVDRTKQAICYTKGCYLGQEPIVMARDRGHVNRLLRGLKIAGSSAVPSGTKVFRDADEVGQVTSSVVSPRFGAIALAYIRRGSWEPGTAVTVAADGEKRSAEVVSLPFDSGAAP
jgi:folate-binding protein YgfZ